MYLNLEFDFHHVTWKESHLEHLLKTIYSVETILSNKFPNRKPKTGFEHSPLPYLPSQGENIMPSVK